MKKIFLFALVFLLSSVMAFAQTDPTDPGTPGCGGSSEPDGTVCPLDTWIVVFAAVALVITVLHLRKKQSNIFKTV